MSRVPSTGRWSRTGCCRPGCTTFQPGVWPDKIHWRRRFRRPCTGCSLRLGGSTPDRPAPWAGRIRPCIGPGDMGCRSTSRLGSCSRPCMAIRPQAGRRIHCHCKSLLCRTGRRQPSKECLSGLACPCSCRRCRIGRCGRPRRPLRTDYPPASSPGCTVRSRRRSPLSKGKDLAVDSHPRRCTWFRQEAGLRRTYRWRCKCPSQSSRPGNLRTAFRSAVRTCLAGTLGGHTA